jgi:hypothetical protein
MWWWTSIARGRLLGSDSCRGSSTNAVVPKPAIPATKARLESPVSRSFKVPDCTPPVLGFQPGTLVTVLAEAGWNPHRTANQPGECVRPGLSFSVSRTP